MNHGDVLATFDRQVRRRTYSPVPGWQVEDLGRLIRMTAPPGGHSGAFIGWTDFAGLDDDAVDSIIAEQVAYFVELGGHSEWKHFAHDVPADLSDRLVAAGLTREDDEALVVGEVAAVLEACGAAGPIHGVGVRAVTDPAELSAVAELHETVYDEDWSWLAAELREEMTNDPDGIVIYVAEDESSGALMCSAWIRFERGSDFAGLWGGATHPDWRRRGAYRALVTARCELARDRGLPYVQVDASPGSEPILRRLGLVRIGTTTPHTWDPS